MNDDALLNFIQEIRQFQGSILSGQDAIREQLNVLDSKVTAHIACDDAHGNKTRWGLVVRGSALATIVIAGIAALNWLGIGALAR